jgi:hypothetical protein
VAVDAVTMLVTVVGSLAAGLLYGCAWGWKGLAMSIAIAIIVNGSYYKGIALNPFCVGGCRVYFTAFMTVGDAVRPSIYIYF